MNSGSNELNESTDDLLHEKPLPNAVSNSFNPPIASERAKTPLPAIASHQNTFVVDTSTRKASIMSRDMTQFFAFRTRDTDLVLPTKVFKAQKKSITDLSQAACSHLWFRRIKEIFLCMGKQNDAFTRFDMDLARTDMIETCEQYLESQRPNVNINQLVCSIEKRSF